MNFHRPLTQVQVHRDDLIGKAPHHTFHHFAFPRSQGLVAFLQAAFAIFFRPVGFIPAHGLVNAVQQVLVAIGFLDKIKGTDLHGIHSQVNISIGCDHDH